jgi:hypothetical protein
MLGGGKNFHCHDELIVELFAGKSDGTLSCHGGRRGGGGGGSCSGGAVCIRCSICAADKSYFVFIIAILFDCRGTCRGWILMEEFLDLILLVLVSFPNTRGFDEWSRV